jgi:hypothetical protein
MTSSIIRMLAVVAIGLALILALLLFGHSTTAVAVPS